MISVKELKDWISEVGLSDDDIIGIDDGGLSIRPANAPNCWIEVGGLPYDNHGYPIYEDDEDDE